VSEAFPPRTAAKQDRPPTRAPVAQISVTWLSRPDGPPRLHVGYDVAARSKGGRRARLAIVSTYVEVEEAFQGDPWTKVLGMLQWIAEGHGELPMSAEKPSP
jgi:hypothetical protein